MQKSNVLALTMESEAFNGLKTDFNQVLRRTLTNMERKESEQAELTVKLKISLEKDTAPDFSEVRYRAERDIVRPTFTHKISSVMQIKCEKSGVLSGNYELVWDEESGDYVMRPIEDGQMSLFDKNGQPRAALSCEGKDVIEADYREADTEGEDASDDYGYEKPDDEPSEAS